MDQSVKLMLEKVPENLLLPHSAFACFWGTSVKGGKVLEITQFLMVWSVTMAPSFCLLGWGWLAILQENGYYLLCIGLCAFASKAKQCMQNEHRPVIMVWLLSYLAGIFLQKR